MPSPRPPRPHVLPSVVTKRFVFEENHLAISDYRHSCTGCFSFVVVNVIFSLYVQFFSFVTLFCCVLLKGFTSYFTPWLFESIEETQTWTLEHNRLLNE